MPEIEIFLGSNLNLTIGVFTWGLANHHNICKKKFNTINWNNTILNMWGQPNKTVFS